ncbi:calcium-activated chloride channel regulator 1-like isoform X2 [Lethenteron reissneri]|uniref:calcium-activated chloride channel regulator 1-like isoform X2 n=1 Tax=Lethenteron reissneri TaxID=7753 RepID=UPI002AB7A394|nr:calcium-activated chloride channel regulator 1-like isoform X2 [Lethenteron reissneri]
MIACVKAAALLFGALTILTIEASNVKLVDHGYEGLVVAIHPSVSENEQLVVKIKEVITASSARLYSSTGRRAFFRNVTILLPASWSPHEGYGRPSKEAFNTADVVVAQPHDSSNDAPYTVQFGLCGEKGQHIRLAPSYLLQDTAISLYGPREKSFLHEWGHLRWGLFDEYGSPQPFYVSAAGNIENTRCSKDIQGSISVVTCTDVMCTSKDCSIDEATNLPEQGCTFYPNSIQKTNVSYMSLQWLDNVTEFCDDKSHNVDAPSMQNRVCGFRSSWEVMLTSEDFAGKENAIGNVPSTQPTFKLVQNSRMMRMRQAAEILIMQVLEHGTYLGIVSFSNTVVVNSPLVLLSDEASRRQLVELLPQTAYGATKMCDGLKQGIQVLSQDNGDALGDEIILLSDAGDTTNENCLETVQQCQCVVHTIALGNTPTQEFEQLSAITGGLQLFATDNVDSNGLVDAFTMTGNRDGNWESMVIQLESKAFMMDVEEHVQGTVYLDSTIGNDTKFVVTEVTHGSLRILITSPNGRVYNTSDFNIDANFNTSRLTIPGIAKPGPWSYFIVNGGQARTLLTLAVTSRVASPTVPPIGVTVRVSGTEKAAAQRRPVSLHALVAQGFRAISGANVTAVVEVPGVDAFHLQMLDNGAGADVIKDDGVYSRYFTQNGDADSDQYSFKVIVQGWRSQTRFSKRFSLKSSFIPGIQNENGETVVSQVLPPEARPVSQPTEDFSRSAPGGNFKVSAQSGWPPCRVTDLTAELLESGIVNLVWTAPGGNADNGRASFYELRVSPMLGNPGTFALRARVVKPHMLLNGSLVSPAPAGSREAITLNVTAAWPWTLVPVLYFALWANNSQNVRSEMSNVALVALVTPRIVQVQRSPSFYKNLAALISSVVASLALLLFTAGMLIEAVCSKKRREDDDDQQLKA